MERRGIAALLVAGTFALATAAGAQTSGTGTSTSQGSQASSSKQEAVGTIKSMDGKKLVLDDGTEFMLPATVTIDPAEVKQGAKVKVSYQQQGGQKVVTSVEKGS